MRKLANIPFAGLILAFLISYLPGSATAQSGSKIGYVDDLRIKQEYRAFLKIEDQWKIEAKAWEDEAISLQTELQELQEEYEKQRLILSEEKKREKEQAILVKSDNLENFTRRIFGPGGEAERRQEQLLTPLLQTVTKAIEAIAIDGTYDVIFTMTQSGLGYISPTLDITDKVLKYLDENEGQ